MQNREKCYTDYENDKFLVSKDYDHQYDFYNSQKQKLDEEIVQSQKKFTNIQDPSNQESWGEVSEEEDQNFYENEEEKKETSTMNKNLFTFGNQMKFQQETEESSSLVKYDQTVILPA